MDIKQIIITMKKVVLTLILASIFLTKGYAQQADVLTLGVFHFEFPNLDVQQVTEDDQMIVLIPYYTKGMSPYSNKNEYW